MDGLTVVALGVALGVLLGMPVLLDGIDKMFDGDKHE